MQDEKLTIRSSCVKDVDFGMRLAAEQGWNSGIYDGEIIAMADPRGGFAAEYDGKVVGFISTFRFNNDYGFSGGLMVDPAVREMGIALALGMASLKYLDCRIVGCDAVLPMQKTYEKRGFVPFYNNLRFVGNAADIRKAKSENNQSAAVVDLKEITLNELFAYDEGIFPAPRPYFLLRWCFQPQSSAFGFIEDGKLAGYGVLRKSLQGYKVGPLFADNRPAAEALFQALADRAGDEMIFVDVPEVNRRAMDLVEKYGMSKVFETCRMYKGGDPQVPAERIYGITSNEIG